jgi:integrase
MPETFEVLAHQYLNRVGGVSGTSKLVARQLQADPLLRWEIVGNDFQRKVDAWTTTRHAGNKPGTVKRQLNVMQAIINMGVRRNQCPPISLEKPRVDDQRVRVLSDAEEEALFDKLPPAAALLFRFMLNTGARLGEATTLEWKDVVHSATTFFLHSGATFTTRKGGKLRRRTVPLNHDASMCVFAFHGASHQGVVFRNAKGEAWGGRFEPDRIMREATKAAGIVDFHPHDLRHTFASRLVAKGTDIRVVAELLGHASLTMVMRYTHLAPSTLASAVNQLS